MTFNRRISRRHFVTTTLALGTTLRFSALSHAAQPSQTGLCKLSAEQETGPYYLDNSRVRSDITEGKAGVPLLLEITVLDARRCAPLADALVEVWQCDALGAYSGFTKVSELPGPPPGPPPGGPDHPHDGPPPGGPDHAHDGPPPGGQHTGWGPVPGGPPPQIAPTDKLTFLRGIQRTDQQGNVTFRTIVPGQYMGRTNHIHFKVREAVTSQAAGHVSHTGQIFFPETLMIGLMQTAPYVDHRIPRTTLANDPVFTQQHGENCIARPIAFHGSDFTKGMRAQITVVVDPSATPGPVGAPPGPRLP